MLNTINIFFIPGWSQAKSLWWNEIQDVSYGKLCKRTVQESWSWTLLGFGLQYSNFRKYWRRYVNVNWLFILRLTKRLLRMFCCWVACSCFCCTNTYSWYQNEHIVMFHHTSSILEVVFNGGAIFDNPADFFPFY